MRGVKSAMTAVEEVGVVRWTRGGEKNVVSTRASSSPAKLPARASSRAWTHDVHQSLSESSPNQRRRSVVGRLLVQARA